MGGPFFRGDPGFALAASFCWLGGVVSVRSPQRCKGAWHAPFVKESLSLHQKLPLHLVFDLWILLQLETEVDQARKRRMLAIRELQ